MATLVSLGATALRPGRRLAELAGRRAAQTLAEPTRWVVLSSLEAALSAG